MSGDLQVDPRLAQIKDCLYRISVKALVIHDGKVLLVQEQDDEWWGFPGGGVDYGETMLDGLRRELTEELGISASDVRINDQIVGIDIGVIDDGVPRANVYYQVTLPIESMKLTNHVIAHDWFTPEEFLELYVSPATDKQHLFARLQVLLADHT
jgi:8-oxo-dGTP pyrophosphatase MutT (NUDIX family)